MKRAARVATYAGAAKARDLVRERAPVKSGLLRQSIRAGSARATGDVLAQAGVYVQNAKQKYANNADNRRKGRAGGTYYKDGPSYYWRFLELGTAHQPAQPFIRPAFDAGEDAIGDAIANRLSSAIDEALTRR